MLNAFVGIPRKIIFRNYDFRVIILNFQQIIKLPFYGFFFLQKITNLHI